MPPQSTTKAAIYLRISLDKTGEHLGVDRQREAALRLCAERGWTPVEYMDNSVSASKVRGPKSAYARLLADVRAGRVGAVIVWDLDRLTRRPREIEDWIELCERNGLRLVTVDGEVDSASANGRMFMRLKATVARHEVEHKAARQRAAHIQRAAKGLPPIGPRAFGWEPDGMTLIQEELRAVLTGAEFLLSGGSLRSLARQWNAEGFSTARHSPWQPYSVRNLYLNPRTAGFQPRRTGAHSYEEAGQGAWPPLLTESTWRAVRGLLSDDARRTTPDTRRRYFLAGLARCGVCGGALTTGGTQHGVRTLKCGNGRHVSRAAAPCEEWVTDVIVERLSRDDAASLLADDTRTDVDALRTEARALRSRLEEFAVMLGEGEMSREQFRTASERARARLVEVETLQADAGRVQALGPLIFAEDVRAKWEGLEVEQRREIVSLLADVTVHPPGRGARTFDPSTVEVVPK